MRDGCEGVGCEVSVLVGACFGGLRDGGAGRCCVAGLGVRGGMGMTQGGISMEEREGAKIWFPESGRKAFHLRGQPSIPPADHLSVVAAPAEAK